MGHCYPHPRDSSIKTAEADSPRLPSHGANQWGSFSILDWIRAAGEKASMEATVTRALRAKRNSVGQRLAHEIIGALACAATITPLAWADASPRAVVDATTSAVIAVLADNDVSADEKRRRVEEIVYARVDFDTLSRLVLARSWNRLNEEQRAEFQRAFKQTLSATYGRSVEAYRNERITIIADRQEADADWTVRTKIVRGGPNDISVDYRLRQSTGSWKIIDVIIEGVSLVSSYRSQFQEVMANGGIDRLLKLMQEKTRASTAAT